MDSYTKKLLAVFAAIAVICVLSVGAVCFFTPRQDAPDAAARFGYYSRVYDVEDGTGDSVMDSSNDAMQTIGQANSGVDIGDVTLNNTEDITVSLDSEVVSVDVSGQGDVPITLDSETVTVGTVSDVISVTLTLSPTTYAAGDVLADTQQIDGALRVTDGTGVIYSLVVQDLDDQGEAMNVYFLKANCSMGTEDSAISIADSCADDIVCVVEVASGDYVDLINSQVAQAAPACLVEAVSGTDDLYVAAESEGTGTYTASGIVLQVGILQD